MPACLLVFFIFHFERKVNSEAGKRIHSQFVRIWIWHFLEKFLSGLKGSEAHSAKNM
jgi:hypothetical protein